MRHTRLSSSSNISSTTRTRRQPRARARTLEELERSLAHEEQIETAQLKAEKKQVEQYMNMAVRHIPEDVVINSMPESTFRKFVITLLLMGFFRSACSSTSEIQSIALRLIKELEQNGVKPAEKEEMKRKVCGYILGKEGDHPMQTMVPAIFNATTNLRRVWDTKWNHDPTFSSYDKFKWEDIRDTRQRITEKMNSVIYELFELRRGRKSQYETALCSAATQLQTKYIGASKLPQDLQLSYEFGRLVCKELSLREKLEKWASIYGHGLPTTVISCLPATLSTRAKSKNMREMHVVAIELIKVIKEGRAAQRAVPTESLFSQPSLFLSQFQDPFDSDSHEQSSKEILDLTMPAEESESEDLFADIGLSMPQESEGTMAPTFSTPAPTSPFAPNPRKRKPQLTPRPSKKPKPSILDGLPPLEEF